MLPGRVPVVDADTRRKPSRARAWRAQLAVPGLRHLRVAPLAATSLPWALWALTKAQRRLDALIYWLDKVHNVHLPASNWK